MKLGGPLFTYAVVLAFVLASLAVAFMIAMTMIS
jgi:hypothetical protein